MIYRPRFLYNTRSCSLWLLGNKTNLSFVLLKLQFSILQFQYICCIFILLCCPCTEHVHKHWKPRRKEQWWRRRNTNKENPFLSHFTFFLAWLLICSKNKNFFFYLKMECHGIFSPCLGKKRCFTTKKRLPGYCFLVYSPAWPKSTYHSQSEPRCTSFFQQNPFLILML